MNKAMNSRELNAVTATLLRSAATGRINTRAASAVASLGLVMVRNAALELDYAKQQKGRIKLAYFEPCEASKE